MFSSDNYNQLPLKNRKECINCQLETDKECNECNFKIRGKYSSKIHFANQFDNHFDNKATNPTTIAPSGAFDKLSPESMDLVNYWNE